MAMDNGNIPPRDNSNLLQHFKIFEDFVRGTVIDAYVLLDVDGRVVKANQHASVLLKTGTKQMMRAASFESLIKFDISGTPLPLKDLISLDAPRREDVVTGISTGGENKLILAAYPFHESGQVIGTFLVMREITGESTQGSKLTASAVKAKTDMLSGLMNRNGLEEHLSDRKKAVEFLPLEAPERVHSVMMMDIDFFKKVNDTYGHPAGDYVIKTVAQVIKSHCRQSDTAFRVGGEEFVVILTSTALSGALVAAEKVRCAIQGYRFEFEGTHIPVTCSIGAAALDVTSADPHADITRADAALYFSKQNGRNRVSFHDGVHLNPHQWEKAADHPAKPVAAA
jgi:diguanylate cyclase (GGDEF)-like protein